MPVCPVWLDVPELLARRETWAHWVLLVSPDLLAFLVSTACVVVMAPRVSPAILDSSACPETREIAAHLATMDPRASLASLALPESADPLVSPVFLVSSSSTVIYYQTYRVLGIFRDCQDHK